MWLCPTEDVYLFLINIVKALSKFKLTYLLINTHRIITL